MWQKVKAWTGPVASWAHSQQPGLPHLTSYSYLISYSHLLPPCVLSAYATRAAADIMQTSIFNYVCCCVSLSLSLSAATGAWTPPDQPPPLHPPIAHTWEERNLLLPVFLCAFMHVVCEPTASMRVWGTCSHDCACLTMRLQKNKKGWNYSQDDHMLQALTHCTTVLCPSPPPPPPPLPFNTHCVRLAGRHVEDERGKRLPWVLRFS